MPSVKDHHKTKAEMTDLERRVLAHEGVLQALIAYMARTEPRFIDHLRERFVEPMRMGKHEHDHRETDDYAEEFIRAVMLLGDVRSPQSKEPDMLGPSKTHPAANGCCSGKETPVRPAGKPKRHPLARVSSRLAVVAGLVASFAFPAFAQDATAPMPAHAQPKSYGEGWECDRGYRRQADECLEVNVPENAFATNRTYGAGWECLHGFQEVDDAVCIKVVVPDGGYLDPSGKSWSCLRGYTEVEDLCAEVVLPSNAYLSDEVYGSDWLCERGYEVNGDTCAAIAVPENAFLNGSSYGQPWTCERGFRENENMCEAVVVPENAFLDDASYGPGWTCERGFAASGDGCTVIDLPDNAHLDRSGTRWECHDNFQRSQGRCVLNE